MIVASTLTAAVLEHGYRLLRASENMHTYRDPRTNRLLTVTNSGNWILTDLTFNRLLKTGGDVPELLAYLKAGL